MSSKSGYYKRLDQALAMLLEAYNEVDDTDETFDPLPSFSPADARISQASYILWSMRMLQKVADGEGNYSEGARAGAARALSFLGERLREFLNDREVAEACSLVSKLVNKVPVSEPDQVPVLEASPLMMELIEFYSSPRPGSVQESEAQVRKSLFRGRA